MPRSSNNRRGRRAFTLIELAFVLVLLGLLATVAVPRLSQLTGANLRQSAERLASLCRYVYDAAVVKNRVYRIQLELDKTADRPQTYWVEYLDESAAPAKEKKAAGSNKMEREETPGTFFADAELLREPASLPSGVRFSGMRRPLQDGVQESGNAFIQFYPNGSADPVYLYLSDDDGKNTYTLLLHPLTGRVRIERGRIENESQLEP